jgi:hypothetical protein
VLGEDERVLPVSGRDSETLDPFNAPYPLTVYADRYSGTYSGGVWLAAAGVSPLFESPAFADDVPCFEWWGAGGARIGRGDSPNAAVIDFLRRWREAGEPVEFDWNGEGA